MALFCPIEKMARQLQAKSIHARVVMSLRGVLHLQQLYNAAKETAKSLGLGCPSLPRRRHIQKRMGDYLRGAPATDHAWESPLHYFRQRCLSRGMGVNNPPIIGPPNYYKIQTPNIFNLPNLLKGDHLDLRTWPTRPKLWNCQLVLKK